MPTSTPPSDPYGTSPSDPYGASPAAPSGDPAPWQQGPTGDGQGPGGLAVAALVVGVVAFLLGLVPFLGLLAGAAAVVLGIVVLRRGRGGSGGGTGRAFGLVGLIGGGLAVLAGLVTTVLFLLGAAGAFDAVTTAASAPTSTSTPSLPSPSTSPSLPDSPSTGDTGDVEDGGDVVDVPSGGPGEAVTAADGVSFTVTNLTCGLATVGEDPLTATAQGQFCVVDVTVANGSNAPVDFSPVDTAAYAGDVQFAPSLEGSIYADLAGASGSINPGQSQPAKVAFDVPAGTVLDEVLLTDDYDDPGVSIRLS